MIANNNGSKKNNDTSDENEYLISSFLSEDEKEEECMPQRKLVENDEEFDICNTNQEDFVVHASSSSAMITLKNNAVNNDYQESFEPKKECEEFLEDYSRDSCDSFSSFSSNEKNSKKKKKESYKKTKVNKKKTYKKKRIAKKRKNTLDPSTEENYSRSVGDSVDQKTKGSKKKNIKKENKNVNEVENDVSENKYGLNSEELKVFDFLYGINRPVTNTELSLNFKKTFSNSTLVNIVNVLEKKELVIVKMYTKTKIYMVSFNVFDTGELVKYKEDVKKLNKINFDLNERSNSIYKELSFIKNMATEEEIEKSIKCVEENILICKEKIKLIGNGNLVSKMDLQKVEEEFKKINKTLNQRKKLFSEIVETLIDNLNISKKKFMEELGIEL